MLEGGISDRLVAALRLRFGLGAASHGNTGSEAANGDAVARTRTAMADNTANAMPPAKPCSMGASELGAVGNLQLGAAQVPSSVYLFI